MTNNDDDVLKIDDETWKTFIEANEDVLNPIRHRIIEKALAGEFRTVHYIWLYVNTALHQVVTAINEAGKAVQEAEKRKPREWN